MDSPLKESRGRSVENIEDGLLIGQRQPLVNELKGRGENVPRHIKNISNEKGEGVRSKMTSWSPC